MDALQFAYWMNGFAELHQAPPTPEQWESIKEHLALVFTKVTPAVLPPSLRDWHPGIVIPLTGDVPWWSRTPQCAAGAPLTGEVSVIC